MKELTEVLDAIGRLPFDWHGAGCLGPNVLSAIAGHAGRRKLVRTAETGTGKSTLLFSHLSAHHTVFAVDDAGNGDSLAQVMSSDILRREQVNFVIGPTQKTLPTHTFRQPLQMVLLDGPHGYPFPELEYYYFYVHLAEDGILIVDDIHIPTIFRLYEFLAEDAMFDTLEVVQTTAFFRRNKSPLFDPLQDGWWLQGYNKARFPIQHPPRKPTWIQKAARLVPPRARPAARRLWALWRSARQPPGS
jgi:Methyltransferase domain